MHPVSEALVYRFSSYDALVHQGLRDGDVVEKFGAHEQMIKNLYNNCMDLKDPEQKAAFEGPYFLHRFICDYRKNKDSPTFLEDKWCAVARYNATRSSTHPDMARLDVGPPVAPIPGPGTPKTTKKAAARAKTTKEAVARPTATTEAAARAETTTEAAAGPSVTVHRKTVATAAPSPVVVSPPPKAIGGPGPSTQAKAAAARHLDHAESPPFISKHIPGKLPGSGYEQDDETEFGRKFQEIDSGSALVKDKFAAFQIVPYYQRSRNSIDVTKIIDNDELAAIDSDE
ncbi:hypothetical protein BYT27DRAFT_7252644 [Phlegmacium glaucopus]|nr:hypothetical protein BYT27DRAFT_7252644 [Phlegmacium glaucopus]